MRIRRSRWLIASAVFVAACSSGERPAASGGAGEATGGTVIITTPTDAGTLFPPLADDQVSRWVVDQLFDRLAELKQDLITVGDKGFSPRLAKSWTWAPDSLSIAFSLDPRARWHDGKPVTANDVRYTFKTFTDSAVASPIAPQLSNIDSVSVRDSLTPVFWFKKRKPEAFYDIAYQLVIIPQHVYGAIPANQLRTSDLTRSPVGSGRFRLEKWDAGSRIALVADTSNWRGRPKLDRVIFTPLSPDAAATQVLTGEADYMDAFPQPRAGALDSSAVARAGILHPLSYGFMLFNFKAPKSKTAPHPIFSDKRVRLALAMSVDRVGMLKNVWGKLAAIGHGPFPMTLGVGDSTIKNPPFDTAAANALLDSAGWRRGADGNRAKGGRPLRFTIVVPTGSVQRMAYGVLLQSAFHAVGAQVVIDQLDGKAMQNRMEQRDFDTAILTFGTDPSPAGTEQFWATSAAGPDGQNYGHYSDTIADALMDSITATSNAARSKTYATRAFQTIVDDVPAVWLYDGVYIEGVNRRITITPPRPDAWWADIADWSIAPDKRIDRDRIGLTPAKP